ncbi:DUF167 domain-containing protein [Thermocrinis sp.]|jgi:uncharacterized protein YggU (UPF0235/DUF167 family)|uniref:DUF167 domain-containing protein n=1 Tax=Thermocrinis sp. TaxID=2024383 RepID=UPI003C0E789E
MLIKVKAKPKAKEEYVKRLGEDFYEVAVKEAPEKGRANARIVELLSVYFGVEKDRKIKAIPSVRRRKPILTSNLL